MLEGKLRVLVHCHAGQVSSVEVRSSRPQVSGALLQGDSVAQALSKVPVIYGICRQAQSLAAQLAARAAGIESARPLSLWLVQLEALQEHLWRFYIDLPSLLGAPPELEKFAPIRQVLLHQMQGIENCSADTEEANRVRQQTLAELRNTVEQQLLGMAFEHWARLDEAAFQAWLKHGETVINPLLARVETLFEPITYRGPDKPIPENYASGNDKAENDTPVNKPDEQVLLSQDSLTEVIELMATDEQFSAQPWLRTGHPEAGSLVNFSGQARVLALLTRGQRVMARLVARLLQIGHLLKPRVAIGCGDIPVMAQSGAGWVETARGILLHRLDIQHGRVQRYQVVAPTEWNFHPEGPLVREALQLSADNIEQLRQQVQLLCLSLDPCVGSEVEVYHA
ncbi:nickel-dependent hydrogenase large subunit [Aestuariirhabdus sp. Z084]|uniref:nickel-dependent hydrogenase large subunit n=1 Tax=Aestuariirhabdus haliotis TaxID=2918751 RepID=UPI00201B3F4B|nr:nickel-dependent hydrogenase large subunit [Aestuariirhabdus haliotis]MCL6415153.1 nickel-dependent hydrogenase large subunit [Aestuariirhabdus haliotis]MCL6420028.1 nickel-dependent hydrogenase large subunit [Aestuariirhabdus haliotis]